ncbi:CPBP family intramembrane glutamic endopeptidase [Bacillota bacterium Meth-B3]
MTGEMSQVKKRILIFTILAMAIAWTVFMIVPLSGMIYGGSMTSQLIVGAAMFAPALASLLTRLTTHEGFGKMYLRPHFRGHGKAYLVLYFGPTLLIIASCALYFLVFPGTFDPSMTMIRKTLAASPAGFTPPVIFLLTVALILTAGPVVNIIPTLGEELGWRGYLLPKLRELTSDRAALVITGVIWGFWHFPIIVMGHNYGTGYSGYPWLGILAMIIFCISLGIVEGYAAIRLDSVIPAAMIHSTVNAGAGLPVLLSTTGSNTLLGPAITGLVGGIPLMILAIVLLVKTSARQNVDVKA